MPVVATDTNSLHSQNTTASGPGPGPLPRSGSSFYPRGPTFSLDTFARRDFIVKDFIESLSDGTAPQNNRRSGTTSQAFDPKPYIRAFEHALNRLGSLSEQRETHESELADAVRRAEAQHRQHCATLQTKLDQALEQFNGLEQGLDTDANIQSHGTGGGNVALQIGERLEELDRQKRRAEDAKFLIQCWQDVSERGDLSHLEDIRRLGGGEGKVRCAQIARQLLRISSRLVPPPSLLATPITPRTPHSALNGVNGNTNGLAPDDTQGMTDIQRQRKTNELIERFLERLEKDLLEQFDECKKQHNERGMRDCAVALHDFNDGASVIGRFVNQHEFFLDRGHMITEELAEDREAWERAADPDAEPPAVESSLRSLIDEVRLVIEEESFTIKHVFPFYEQVLVTFLQRIFQQSIQQRLEMVLEKANSISPLAFLRALQASRNYIGLVVEDLKQHGLTEHPDPVSPHVASTLDQQVEDLFIPYFAGSTYIDMEKRSLEELYASLLYRFTVYHSRRRKVPTSYLGSLGQRGKELLNSARDNYVDRISSTELPAFQKTMLMRIAGIRDDSSDKAEIEVSDKDGTLSLPTAKRMLKWLAEAVGRGLELSGGSETPKEVAVLLKLLLVHLGEIYLDTALDAAIESATSQESSSSKSEPDLSFIPTLRPCITILHLLLTLSSSVLLPLATPTITLRREMDKDLLTHRTRLEDKIATLRTRTIDIVLAWVSKLLARQPKSDFRPRDDEAMAGLESLCTGTCSSVYDFLSRVHKSCITSLDGSGNQTPFFTDLAIGVRVLLFDHFKKFQVNLAGGLMVSKDITRYIELLKTWPVNPSFLAGLEVLVEVGNLFVIGPEALMERVRGAGGAGGGGVFGAGMEGRREARGYIMRREDAASIGVQMVLSAL